MAQSRNIKRVYVFLILLSFFLYLAGVFSGLYAGKLIKKQTQEDIKEIKSSLDRFKSNLENIQIQQSFFNLLSEEESCRFSKIAMDYLIKELGYFWDKLPYRIEEYKSSELEQAYENLKKEYTFLALKAWAIATKNYDQCDKTRIPLLYFYSKNCETCIKQGLEIDKFKYEMSLKNKEVIAFAIDLSLNESSVELIKEFYNITKAPAIIFKNKVLSGSLYDEKKLEDSITK